MQQQAIRRRWPRVSLVALAAVGPVLPCCTQATLVGAKVWVFGGEDAARRPLDDVHVLNLADMSWSTPQLTGKGPSRRSAHTAAAFADRWLLVFGGGSLVSFADVHTQCDQ